MYEYRLHQQLDKVGAGIDKNVSSTHNLTDIGDFLNHDIHTKSHSLCDDVI